MELEWVWEDIIFDNQDFLDPRNSTLSVFLFRHIRVQGCRFNGVLGLRV